MTCESKTSLLKDELEQQQEEVRDQFPAVKRVSESLVQIVSYSHGKPIGQASSLVVEGGYLITAWHAIKEADNIILYPSPREHNFATSFDGGEIVVYPDLDVAVFPLPEVLEGMIPPIQLATDHSGDRVFLVGFPVVNRKLQWQLYDRQPTIRLAYITSRKDGKLKMLSADFDWEVVNGMSGGAVVNQAGKAIGIITASAHLPDIHTHKIWATDISFVRFHLIDS